MSAVAPARPSARTGLLAVLLLGLAVVLGLLVVPRLWAPEPAPPAFKGGALTPPTALPPLTLQRADGRSFTTADTIGRTSFFVFGYTRCPDFCPLTLVQVAQLHRQLGADAANVDTYFVTVDPARDTPERLREYTANFDPTIVGLTGTPDQLTAAYAAFGVVAQRRDAPERPGDYFMDHTALSYLVDAGGRIRLVYPYPLEPADVAADVRALAATQPIRVADAWVRATTRSATPGLATTAAYLTIVNTGRAADALVGVSSDAADAVDLHVTRVENGVARMEPVTSLDLPPGGKLVFAPGGSHVMLTGLRADLPPGSEVVLRFRFARAGEVAVRAQAR